MADWKWREIEIMWEHPDWTSVELHELIPRHSPQAIRHKRMEWGRWHRSAAPLCCKCEERPVWMESPKAKRYGLCKGCYLDEERMRLEDEARATALRQMERRRRRGA